MKPASLLGILLLAALAASGWLTAWKFDARKAGSPQSEDAAFAALEKQNQALREELADLENELLKARQQTKGDLSIPPIIVDELAKIWPDHPKLPELRKVDDSTLFQTNLDRLEKIVPESTFATLLERCGIIDSRSSFLRQMALTRSEGARAIAGEDSICLVSSFDFGSIPDQAELLSAIYHFWLQNTNPLPKSPPARLEADLRLRACAQMSKARFQMQFAKRGEAFLPSNRTANTPIEELPLAVRQCVKWQAGQQLKIDRREVEALHQGQSTSKDAQEELGLGRVFTPIPLDPTASQDKIPAPTGQSLASNSSGDLIWTLKFTPEMSDKAEQALRLYFSDWPDDFGTAPAISRTANSILLVFRKNAKQ